MRRKIVNRSGIIQTRDIKKENIGKYSKVKVDGKTVLQKKFYHPTSGWVEYDPTAPVTIETEDGKETWYMEDVAVLFKRKGRKYARKAEKIRKSRRQVSGNPTAGSFVMIREKIKVKKDGRTRTITIEGYSETQDAASSKSYNEMKNDAEKRLSNMRRYELWRATGKSNSKYSLVSRKTAISKVYG